MILDLLRTYCNYAGLAIIEKTDRIIVHNDKHILFTSGGDGRTLEKIAESIIIRILNHGVKKAIEEWDEVDSGHRKITINIDYNKEPQFNQ